MDAHINAKPLTNMEVASFCSQMALILKSGISSMEGISIMIEDCSSTSEKDILVAIWDTLTSTGNFHEALKSSGVFPKYLLHMTDIGEQSGKLDEVMQSLSRHYEREASIANAIKNSITYPFVMISMMMLVILIMVMKVLPIFNQVFEDLSLDITGFSKGILNLGVVLNQYSFLLIIVFLFLLLLFLFCAYTVPGRSAFARIAGSFGPGKSMRNKISACRFASGMALTLSSGLTSEESLELAGILTDNASFQAKVLHCKNLSNSESNLSTTLLSAGIFTGIYARMVTVGCKTGTLDEVMQTIAIRYEEELDDQISRIIAMLEPTLVAILSIIVGIILLSVMLPLMGIMSGF